MAEKEIDDVSGTETTGHEWDGIKELNTPMPRWWLWTFYATILFALGYVVAYPAIPLISEATGGILGYSSRGQYAADAQAAAELQAEPLARIAELAPADIIADAELARFARAGGASVYKVYCSQCHGSGAQGAAGIPNLNDDEWIWGGTPSDIHTTIAHGIRSPIDEETRFNEMPAFGRDQLLESADIRAVAHYVASLSGSESDPNERAHGAQVFADNCTACHGERGDGDQELGGPSLDDAIWLYGDSTIDGLIAQISTPSHGVMPSWADKLSDDTIKQLTVYVHGLGGGQ